MPEFLVFCVHRHFEFRYPELSSLLELRGVSIEDALSDESDPKSSPLLRLTLPSVDHARFLSERGILVKGVYEIWGHTKTNNYDDLVQAVAQCDLPSKQKILSDPQTSWSIRVDAFGKKLSTDDQHWRREKFSEALPFEGPVVMQDPDELFLILEELHLDKHNQKEADVKQMYFLRKIAGSERNRGRGGARDLIDQQTLKRRKYIGPTAMESEMALLMCNMAQVQASDVVIDPFVGTGSVLVPCATQGAICFGMDIDIRVLLGTGVGVSGATNDDEGRVNVLSNFKQYNLPLPELLRADNSLSPIMSRCKNFFDAVVCDPPYGIRAGARKSGRKERKKSPRPVDASRHDETYVPPTQPYAAEDVMKDLLEFAAVCLRMGGRLVYLLPTTYEYTEEDVPTHPQLKVVANSEQKLTKKYARRLITMVKVKETKEEVTSSADRDLSYANIREKILETNRRNRDKQSASRQ